LSKKRQILLLNFGFFAFFIIFISLFIPEDILNISCENAERIKAQSAGIPLAEINRALIEISKTSSEAKWSAQPRILLELCIVTLSEREEAFEAAPAARREAAAPPAARKVTAAPAAPAAPETPKPPKENKPDSLWDSLFSGEDGLKGSFNMIRSGAELISVSGGEYTVAVHSDTARNFIEKNRAAIEERLNKRTGMANVIRCVDGEVKNGGKSEKPPEEFSAEVGNLLGLTIEIEEE